MSSAPYISITYCCVKHANTVKKQLPIHALTNHRSWNAKLWRCRRYHCHTIKKDSLFRLIQLQFHYSFHKIVKNETKKHEVNFDITATKNVVFAKNWGMRVHTHHNLVTKFIPLLQVHNFCKSHKMLNTIPSFTIAIETFMTTCFICLQLIIK